MKKRTILLLFLLILSIYALNINVQSAVEENNYRHTSLELTPYGSISITSDSDFEVFPGSGTETDPYIIENYYITPTFSRGIFIYSTTKYFTVRNCYIDADDGIYIYEVANGTATIINNTCNNNNGEGISLVYSGNSTVVNNTCNNNGYRGIYLFHSGGSTVANNTCNNNGEGISLGWSDSSTVANNTCNNNNDYGIYLQCSGSSTVANNTFTNCGLYIREDSIDDYLSNTVENNWVNGKIFGFYTNLDSTTIAEPVYGQLLLVNCTDVTVRDQILNNASIGLFLLSCTNSVIINNTCNNNGYGIYLCYSGSATVSNNTCSNNNYYGIYLLSSGSLTVANNTFTNCGLYIGENSVYAYLSYTVENNWVNGKKIGFYTNLDSTIITDPVYGQLLLVNCTNVTVRDQKLNNATIGLFLYSCTSSVIINNTCSNNNLEGIVLLLSGSSTVINNTCSNNNGWAGILLRDSDSSTVANNTCNNKDRGIYLYSSGSSTVSNNSCNDNYWDGISISFSGSSTVINNTCSSNRDGIYLYNSDSSTVTNNTCYNNNRYGIYLYYSDFCVVTYNLLQENEFYGVNLRFDSDNNTIHHNTFVDYNLGGILYGNSQALDYCTNNTWYNSTTLEGNYWSDWSGTGSYSIDGSAGAIDLYPLDKPVVDVNPPLIVDIIHSPATPTELDIISINATVTDASGVQSVTLHYRINGGSWQTISMTFVSGDLYSVTLGSFTISDTIEYYVSAIDNSANYNEATEDNSGQYYDIFVGSSDVTGPTINNIVHSPSLPTELDTISINITVIDASGVQSVTLYYKINSGAWTEVSMTFVSGDLYSVTLGSFAVSDIIEYYITAEDNSINRNEATEDNEGSYYVLIVGSSDVIVPSITGIIHSPATPTELDTISFNATVTDDSGIYSVTLHYRINDGSWQTISMTLVNGDLYSVTLGPFAVSDTIDYYISAVDYSVNHNSAVNDNSGLYYSFNVSEVIPEFQTLSLLLPTISFLFLICGLVVLQRRKK